MKTLIAFGFSLLYCQLLSAQNVSTFYNSNTIQIDDGMVQDRHGNLYGSHYMGTNVYKITPNGTATVFSGGYNTPNGLAFNSLGELYVVDNIGNRIYKLDSLGNRIDTVAVSSPSGIIKSIDSDTMIFTQYAGHTIRKLAPNGNVSSPIKAGYPLSGPVGLCYGPDSALYIGNFTDRKILKLDSGQLTYVATVPGLSGSNLGFITFAGDYIYGTAFQENKIYRVNPRLVNSVVLYAGSNAGNTDGPLNQAKFNSPNGILASRGGDSLFISDFNTGNVRLITGLVTNLSAQNSEEELSVYPNPSNGKLYINSPKKISSIQVFDLKGQLLFEKLEFNENWIQLPEQKGLYLLKGLTTDGEAIVRKVIKED